MPSCFDVSPGLLLAKRSSCWHPWVPALLYGLAWVVGRHLVGRVPLPRPRPPLPGGVV